MKKKINPVVFSTFIVAPMLLSAIAARYSSIIVCAITILGIFVMLKLPLFKYRENLWMFVISTFATIPLNIRLLKMLNDFSLFDYNIKITSVFGYFVIYSVIFAIEQIALGIITRLLFRKQYKLFDVPDES